MYFLVDYENQEDASLRGAEFLLPEDHLYIFYSKCCRNMARPLFETIIRSGCELKLYGLGKSGRNANDFGIASKIAEILTADPSAQVSIISKDKDFVAVRSYWLNQADRPRNVILAEDIGAVILLIHGRKDQKEQIMKQRERVNFPEELAKLHNSPAYKLKNIVGEDKTKAILELQDSSPKELYTGCLKICGRADGLAAYHMM